jgi:hypothetical protein
MDRRVGHMTINQFVCPSHSVITVCFKRHCLEVTISKSQSPSEAKIRSASQEIPAFYVTNVHAVFTKVCHWSLN